MATLKEIKVRINAIKNTQKITKAMKMVAAAKLRRAQDRIISTRPYAYKLSELLKHMISVSEIGSNPLAEVRVIKSKILVVVSSDRGLCGSFNTNLIKHVTELVGNNKDTVKLFIIGKKANEFFSKRGYNIIKSYTNLFSSLDINIVRDVASLIVKGFLNKEYDSVEIVYNEFKSVMRQNVVTESFLPLAKPEIIKNQVSSNIDYIYEPSSAVILNELIPRQLNMQLWKSLLESNAAEQGARMTAMEMATKNARDLIQYLELIYNRARQESITKELLEIVAGAEALKEN